MAATGNLENLVIIVDGIQCTIPVTGIQLPEKPWLHTIPKRFRPIVKSGRILFNSNGLTCLKKFRALRSVSIYHDQHTTMTVPKACIMARRWMRYLGHKIRISVGNQPWFVNPVSNQVDISLCDIFEKANASRRIGALVFTLTPPEIPVYNTHEDADVFKDVMLRATRALMG